MNSVAFSLGDLVREYRTKSEMTLSELARATDVSKGTLSKLENGEVKKPDYQKLQVVMQVLGIPYEDYIGLYVQGEKNTLSLWTILEETIERKCSSTIISQIAKRYLIIVKGESYDAVAELYRFAMKQEEESVKFDLLSLIFNYSRSHGIMPYYAKSLFQKYIIERNDFTKLNETYQSGKYILNYAGFLDEEDRLGLYYRLAVHAYSLSEYLESIDLSHYVVVHTEPENILRSYAVFTICNAHYYLNEFDKSREYFRECTKFEDSYSQDNVKFMIGCINARSGNIELGMKQLESYLENPSEWNIVHAVVALMDIYMSRVAVESAKKLFEYETIMEKSIQDPRTAPLKRAHLAHYYKLKGDILLYDNDSEAALEYYAKSTIEYSKISAHNKAYNWLCLS
ncbi:helix-turn-helix domain-containing protein [Paenibacillus sp. SC116]|uniref:helix-turn-helix domain-containing protein n=1 Tax=Paenibacillus sp. SC116 TaxID=2968986 RepID=UPI00215AAC5D|nr:helix-turn-helix domain-containing protein [Paenibacillus sp. SC116]MCR8845049.1 helix-turn-helix domain-containing protein [Paenibacillus sp. SC116]